MIKLINQRCLSAHLLRSVLVSIGLARAASGELVFDDGFESGQWGIGWSTGVTLDGRVRLETDFGPASGVRHLVLDDMLNDNVSSVAEAILQLNLAQRRQVTLSFKAKSLGNEAHPPPAGIIRTVREFDGVTVSFDAGVSWHAIQSLANLGSSWESFTIGLDAVAAAAGATYSGDVRIRFSAYDNSPAPLDGIAIDDVTVVAQRDQQAALELPSELVEGGPEQTGFVVLRLIPAETLVLNLSSTQSTFNLPATVTVPAGETAASFKFSVIDDTLFQPPRTVSIQATATGVVGTPADVLLTDNEVPVVTLELPAQVKEGETTPVNASVSMDLTAGIPLTFALVGTPLGQVTYPSTVVIPAGQSQARFAVRAVNDTGLDGDVTVTMQAVSAGLSSVSNQVKVIDNEPRTFDLQLPGALAEGESGTGLVRISGIMTTDLVIALSAPEQGGLALPPTITIRSGQTQATFQVTAVEDKLPQLAENVAVTASAPTFTPGRSTLFVTDNDVASFQVNSHPQLVQAGRPYSFTIRPLNANGEGLFFEGPVTLSVVQSNGQSLPLAPEITAQGNVTVTMPAVTSTPVRVRVTNDLNAIGESGPVEVTRALSLKVGDLAWDARRGRLYASVRSNDPGPYANSVVAVDPETLQIQASVPVGENPARLLLTAGGERLYVSRDGNGSIAWIDPESFAVQSSFLLGRSPTFDNWVLYAEDLASPADQPNTLVVVRSPRQGSDVYNTVAAYRDGLMLPQTTVEFEPNCQAIEPSTDPTLFYALDRDQTMSLRWLRLHDTGVVWEKTFPLSVGFAFDFKVDGNTAVFSSGGLVNAATGRGLGNLESMFGGVVTADLAVNRVFLLHRGISFDDYGYLSTYDTVTQTQVRGVTVNPPFYLAGSLIRWGAHGLAFKTSDSLVVMNSTDLVPAAQPADLSTRIQLSPYPSSKQEPFPFDIQVTNNGPETARGVVVDTALFGRPSIVGFSATQGRAQSIHGVPVEGVIGDLAPGASASLRVTLRLVDSITLGVRATARSASLDPVISNNIAHRLAAEAYPVPPQTNRTLLYGANNLVSDNKRKCLWITTTDPSLLPAEAWLIAIDPTTGRMDQSVRFAGKAAPKCMDLSDNDRYLYVGLENLPEVIRFDLDQDPPTGTRIVLPKDRNGNNQHAADIEVLEGDGLSFVLVSGEERTVFEMDGDIARPPLLSAHRFDRIERVDGTNTFVGQQTSAPPYESTRFAISGLGFEVGVHRENPALIPYEIDGSGPWLLNSLGQLLNASTLLQVHNFDRFGGPCLDLTSARAFLCNGHTIYAFDIQTGGSIGSKLMSFESWERPSIERWGMDGFAVAGGYLTLVRWSEAMAAGQDSNANSIPDRWEATNLGAFGGNLRDDPDDDGLPSGLEYVFGTPAGESTTDPRQVTRPEPGVLRLVFPRRAGLIPGLYAFETSGPALDPWTSALPSKETVLSTEMVEGVTIETVEAEFNLGDSDAGFVRLVWPPR